MKAAKLGWPRPRAWQEQAMSRPGAGWERARSRPGAMQEQGRSKSRAGALAVHIPNFIQIVLKTEIKTICYRSVLIGWYSQSEKKPESFQTYSMFFLAQY